MITNYYDYFKNIYNDTNDDAVICVDEKLQVIYFTPLASSMFGVPQARYIHHLDNFLTRRRLNNVTECITKNRSRSYKFESKYDGAERKCIIIPTEVEGQKFATLIFYNTSKNNLDDITKKQIDYVIQDTNDKILHQIHDLSNDVRAFKTNDDNFLLKKRVIQGTQEIIHSIKNLETIIDKYETADNMQLINIDSYIKEIVSEISKRFYADRIEIECFLTCDYPYSLVSREAFDVIVCEIISIFIKSSLGKAKVKICTKSLVKENVVAITNATSDVDLLARYFDKMTTSDIVENSTLFTIKTMIKRNGGELYTTRSEDGSYIVMFTLKKDPMALDELRSPSRLKVDRSLFSAINIALSEAGLDIISELNLKR